jgi:hypothetical protein
MPLPALQLLEKKIEQQKRLFEVKKVELEREIERHILLFEQKKGAFEKKIEQQFESHRRKFEQRLEMQKRKFGVQIRRFEQKNGIRLDDEVRFIRTWIEKPLSLGAVTPSAARSRAPWQRISIRAGRARSSSLGRALGPSPRHWWRKASIRRGSSSSSLIRPSAGCSARATPRPRWCRAMLTASSGCSPD